jgi:hypothetical protein
MTPETTKNGTKTATPAPAEKKTRPPTKPFTGLQAANKCRNIINRVADPEQRRKAIAAVAALAELT